MVGDLIYIIKHDRQILLGLLVVLIALGVIIFGGKDGSDTLLETRTERTERMMPLEKKKGKIRLQRFDPNTADTTTLLALGLQRWQVRNILRYRSAGGVYSRPEDFGRTYGLTAGQYRMLRPYIVIGEEYRPASELPEVRNRQKENYKQEASERSNNAEHIASAYPQKLRDGETIAVNEADTNDLRRVPGVGPFFARKVVRYRELLGGFVKKEQLLEIPDFPESALPYINVKSDGIKRVNINKASTEQLRRHPYVSYYMARQIADYRRIHGTITDISQLRLLPSFSSETIERIRPYIEY